MQVSSKSAATAGQTPLPTAAEIIRLVDARRFLLGLPLTNTGSPPTEGEIKIVLAKRDVYAAVRMPEDEAQPQAVPEVGPTQTLPAQPTPTHRVGKLCEPPMLNTGVVNTTRRRPPREFRGQMVLWEGFGDQSIDQVRTLPAVRSAVQKLTDYVAGVGHSLPNAEALVLQCGPLSADDAIEHHRQTRRRRKYKNHAAVIAAFMLNSRSRLSEVPVSAEVA